MVVFSFSSRNILWGLVCLFLLAAQGTQAQNSTTLRALTSATESMERIHIVQRGQSLYGIAKQYGMEVEEIKRMNRLVSNTIYSGQRLIVNKNRYNVNRRVAGEVAPTQIAAANARVAGPPQQQTRSLADPEATYPVAQPNAEDIWVRSHLRMLKPDDAAPRIEQSYFDRRDQSDQQSNYYVGDPSSANRRTRSQSGGYYREDQSQGTTVVGRRVGNTNISQSNSRIYHEVKRGENIYDIAKMYKVDVAQVRRWNNTQSVYPGQTLKIETGDRQRDLTPKIDLNEVEDFLTGTGSTNTGPVIRPQMGAGSSSSTPNISVPRSQQRLSSSKTYAVFSQSNQRETFYAFHPNLPSGTVLKLAIPGNQGYLEVKVVGRLQPGSRVDLGLSPTTVEILEAAGAKGRVQLLESQQDWTQP